MSEWKEYKLGDVCTELSDGLHKAPIFKEGGDYIFVNAKNIANGFIVDNDPTKKSTYEEFLKYSSPLNDTTILYSIDGTIGNIALYRGEKCILGKGACYMNPNPQMLNRMYLYYELQSPRFKAYIDQMSTGSTIQHISLKTMRNYIFSCPPLSEQNRIASILSSLDDKIDLLNRENATLEAMAEALFRQWFIEEAKEDWEEVALGDVVKTTSGGTPSRKHPDYYNNGTIYWVKSKELQGSFISSTEEMITEDAMNNSSAKLLPEKTVLIAMYGATVGEYGILSKPMTCNQAVCALIPNNNYPYTYLYLWTALMKQEFINLATGAAQQNISQDLIKQQLVSGDIERIKKYHEHVCAYFDKMECNQNQIKILSKQRDILLPKLMSNEITIQWGEGQFYYI